jgi:hypothetical protein
LEGIYNENGNEMENYTVIIKMSYSTSSEEYMTSYEMTFKEALDSMTVEEFNTIYILNETMKASKIKYSQPGLTKDQYADLLAAYKSDLAAYRAATARWPILDDGF